MSNFQNQTNLEQEQFSESTNLKKILINVVGRPHFTPCSLLRAIRRFMSGEERPSLDGKELKNFENSIETLAKHFDPLLGEFEVKAQRPIYIIGSIDQNYIFVRLIPDEEHLGRIELMDEYLRFLNSDVMRPLRELLKSFVEHLKPECLGVLFVQVEARKDQEGYIITSRSAKASRHGKIYSPSLTRKCSPELTIKQTPSPSHLSSLVMKSGGQLPHFLFVVKKGNEEEDEPRLELVVFEPVQKNPII